MSNKKEKSQMRCLIYQLFLLDINKIKLRANGTFIYLRYSYSENSKNVDFPERYQLFSCLTFYLTYTLILHLQCILTTISFVSILLHDVDTETAHNPYQ